MTTPFFFQCFFSAVLNLNFPPDSVSQTVANGQSDISGDQQTSQLAAAKHRQAEFVASVARAASRLAADDERLAKLQLAAQVAADEAAHAGELAAQAAQAAAEEVEHRTEVERNREAEWAELKRARLDEEIRKEEEEQRRLAKDAEWKRRCETFMRKKSSMFNLNTIETFT